MEAAPHPWPALGVLLLRDGYVTTEDLEEILAEQRDQRRQRLTGWRLGEIVVERGVVTQDQVARLVAEQYELPFVELDENAVDPRIAARLPEELVERFSALPIEIQPEGSLLLAVADPAAVLFSDELRRAVGMPLHFAVAAPAALRAAIVSARARAPQTAASFDPPSFALVRASAESYASASVPDRTADDAASWPPLGTLLVRDGLVSEEELETALAQQRLSSTKRLGEILVERGSVTRTEVARVIAEQYELPFIDLAPAELDARIGALLPVDVSRRYSAVPVRFEPDGSLLVAVADPTRVLDPEEILAVLGGRFTFAVADPDAIEAALLRNRLEADAAAGDPADETPPSTDGMPAATLDDPVDDGVAADAGQGALDEREDDIQPADAGDGDDAREESLLVALAPLETADDAPASEAPSPLPDLDSTPDDASARADVVALVPSLGDEHADDVLRPVDDASETEAGRGAAVVVVSDDSSREDPGGDEADVADESRPDRELEADALQLVPDDERSDHPEPATDGTVEELLEQARLLAASSVHFSPQEARIVVRARVDGTMREIAFLADDARATAEQDLRALTDDHDDDVQVAVLPTRHGDSFAVQLPENRDWSPSLSDLALPEDDEAALREALANTSGLVLVVGPPESGRTTTLYAALGELEPRERALVTVESPVHRLLAEVDQVAVDEHFDGDVARAFTSALAVDPDVILVDEVTDAELARLTVHAAPGRLVLTTLAAPSAGTAVRWLEEHGVEIDACTRALTVVVTQRVVRRLCTSCRESYFATADDLAELGRPEDEAGRRLLARGKGCRSCVGTGFRGRIGVLSVLVPPDELTAAASRGDAQEVVTTLEALGMERLRASAVRLCLDGVTTPAEALKAVSPTDDR